MKFQAFAKYLQQIEETRSRNEMTEILAKMFGEAKPTEARLMAYLSLGQLGPQYNNPEFGIATKSMVRIIAKAFELKLEEVRKRYKELGDLGEVTQGIKNPARIASEAWRARQELGVKKGQKRELTIAQVYKKLLEIAKGEGEGSQERKLEGLSGLLNQLTPLSAKYVVRIPIGKLRLGFSDITILDALSWMEVGDKSKRIEIERAYNVSADIGRIVRKVKEGGVRSLEEIAIEPGTPIRMAAAERLPGAEAIVEKVGEVAAEPKIDGFRLQVHAFRHSERSEESPADARRRRRDGSSETSSGILRSAQDDKPTVRLFSRNLDDMTEMFPEIVEAVKKLPVESIIFEGEAIAHNPETEEFLPFQETMQRRRKYDVKKKAKQLPLKLFAFDLLYLDGEDYLNKPYKKRREKLSEVIARSGNTLNVIEGDVYDSAEKLQIFFLKQIEHGLEGIVAKRLDAIYTAGARNFNWIKLKREGKNELDDSLDCLVLGYKFGTGKRSELGIGAFLVGVYDEEGDVFRTISNVGTGLTDEQWREMKLRADALGVKSKPARYNVPQELEQDVWIQPKMVVEILADEITRSPLHTAGKVDSEPGYALRFPRLIKWRDDKAPEQATSVAEIKSLYKDQKG